MTFDPLTFKNPPWDHRVDLLATKASMELGDVVYSCSMRIFLELKKKKAQFNNEVHYAILKYGNSYTAVVLKPKTGGHVTAAYAEKLAYEVYEKTIAKHTGHHIIPPTVVRKMPDDRVASCQYYVETGDDEDMWNQEFRQSVFEKANQDLVREMAVFNTVFNNWDRHPGNFLATQRKGDFYLASIDNESIENRGVLTKWGKRCYIPVLFTEDPRADVEEKIMLPRNPTIENLKKILDDYGFKMTPRIQEIFKSHPYANRLYYITRKVLMMRFYRGNKAAFPLPIPLYSPTLIDAYRQLKREDLEESFSELVQLNPKRFSTRVDDILARRNMFLEACSKDADHPL